MVYRYSRFKNKLVGYSVYWVYCTGCIVLGVFCVLGVLYWVYCTGCILCTGCIVLGVFCVLGVLYWVYCTGCIVLGVFCVLGVLYWVYCTGCILCTGCFVDHCLYLSLFYHYVIFPPITASGYSFGMFKLLLSYLFSKVLSFYCFNYLLYLFTLIFQFSVLFMKSYCFYFPVRRIIFFV